MKEERKILVNFFLVFEVNKKCQISLPVGYSTALYFTRQKTDWDSRAVMSVHYSVVL